MGQTTVTQFAGELKMPASVLLEQLQKAGVDKARESDLLSEQDKSRLLDFLRRAHGDTAAKSKITLTRKETSEIRATDSTGRARTVQVDATRTREPLVHRLARILFKVRTSDADPLARAIVLHHVERAFGHDRQLVLADLVALRQVRVEVVLPGENGLRLNLAVQSQSPLYRQFHRLPAQHRQRARKSQAHRADVGVRRIANFHRTGTENLCARGELAMDFQPDNHLILG